MKNCVIIIFTFSFYSIFAQKDVENKILHDILATSYSYSKPKIITQISESNIEIGIKKLAENRSGFFTEKNDDSLDSLKAIVLTKKEKDYLIKSMRKLLSQKWKAENFTDYGVIEPNESSKYLEIDNNTVANISKPILFRNKTLALVYFANYVGDGGQASLGIYMKQNGIWKIWAQINGKDY